MVTNQASIPELVGAVYSDVDATDTLWILDPASPKMKGVQEGGAKLVKVDLKTNKVGQVYRFDSSIAPANTTVPGPSVTSGAPS